MSNEIDMAAIRLKLATLGIDPSRVRGVETDEAGNLQIVVERERPAMLDRRALMAAMIAAAPPAKRSRPIMVGRQGVLPMPAEKPDRYRPCECGSGAKFKFCCGRRVA